MRDLRPYFLGASVGAYGEADWACDTNTCRADQLKVQPHPQTGLENIRVLTKSHDVLGLFPVEDAYRAIVFRPDDAPHVPAGACMVAFRGCKKWPPNLAELETGANMSLEPLTSVVDGPAVHSGIVSVYKQFEADLVNELTNMGCQTVVTTGHSMGGCLGTIAAWNLKHEHNFDVLHNVAFQPPRCVNTSFAQLMDSPHNGIPTTHVTVGRDPITHVLPRVMDYVHPGIEIHLDIDQRVQNICDPEYVQSLGQCASQFSNNLTEWNFGDHFALKLKHFQ